MKTISEISPIRTILRCLNRNRHHEDFDDVELFRVFSDDLLPAAAALLPQAKAQLRQDILVAVLSRFKRNGYFVEFGATDGVYLSNTFLLEEQLGWTGILAEPARVWLEALRENRPRAVIDDRCVYEKTGAQLMFREVQSDFALSTIVEFSDVDLHRNTRKIGETYPVETITLEDLLTQNGAPEVIDFISIDTEGSELSILKGFDFSLFQFNMIACEHNYSSTRDQVLNLLKANGYYRILNEISMFDDWFVHESLLPQLDLIMPGWEGLSDQQETGTRSPKSKKDIVIELLQETVESLVIDRDSRIAHVDQLKNDADLMVDGYERAISDLRNTIENLIVERDALKAASDATRSNGKKWLAVMRRQ
ncbi:MULTISPECIES: FkbM family methyltransferase [unclassified Rhizobium]|uniref:FkbM family methyltransferase n=1 Tax=unclassified Rhizobium TaxID=2613769 RepID=UPI00247A6292|nr:MULTISPECIES: FkbM family methyltransferase [unclassified Rhizobium]MDH7804206.1 FkbM family methyltransferase [Rhizobium sp. AN70]